PSWASDRRWIAFAASPAPEENLYPQNLFIARPDGAEPRQVTPMPNAGQVLDDGPKGVVRGRAVLLSGETRRPLPNLPVGPSGLRKGGGTDDGANFRTFLPAGGGWIKLSGQVDGRPHLAWRFAPAIEGRVTDLKDVPVLPGVEDQPSTPAWCDQDR